MKKKQFRMEPQPTDDNTQVNRNETFIMNAEHTLTISITPFTSLSCDLHEVYLKFERKGVYSWNLNKW